MSAKLRRFQRDLASFILRWGLASIFIVHGATKVQQPAQLIPEMSMTIQTMVGWAELLGGLALAAGLLSRVAALDIIVLQVGAIIKVTGQYAMVVAPVGRNGFEYRKVGPEFNLMLIAMSLCVLVLGSGVFSIDHLFVVLWRSRQARRAPISPAPEPRGTPAPVPTHHVTS